MSHRWSSIEQPSCPVCTATCTSSTRPIAYKVVLDRIGLVRPRQAGAYPGRAHGYSGRCGLRAGRTTRPETARRRCPGPGWAGRRCGGGRRCWTNRASSAPGGACCTRRIRWRRSLRTWATRTRATSAAVSVAGTAACRAPCAGCTAAGVGSPALQRLFTRLSGPVSRIAFANAASTHCSLGWPCPRWPRVAGRYFRRKPAWQATQLWFTCARAPTAAEVLASADAACYQAKRHGRNRVALES